GRSRWAWLPSSSLPAPWRRHRRCAHPTGSARPGSPGPDGPEPVEEQPAHLAHPTGRRRARVDRGPWPDVHVVEGDAEPRPEVRGLEPAEIGDHVVEEDFESRRADGGEG